MVPGPALALGEPSRTAKSAAMHRAAHQLFDRPLVFRDPLALDILGSDTLQKLVEERTRRSGTGSRTMRAFIVARSRYAEDSLARAYAEGVRQYVVLGAGLDTFAYRNPYGDALAVFEVDHPATQAWKRERLREQRIAVPSNLAWVAVDFEAEALDARLAAARLRKDKPAVVSWLGVTVYLTRDAVLNSLRALARCCAPGSTVVFDFAVPASDLSETERRTRERRSASVERIGEPWMTFFEPAALRQELLALGAQGAEVLDAAALNQLYFRERTDNLGLRGASGRLMTVTL